MKIKWPAIGSLADLASTVLLLKALTLIVWVGAFLVFAVGIGFDREETFCGSRISSHSVHMAKAALIESGVPPSSFSVELARSQESAGGTEDRTNQSDQCLVVMRRALGYSELLENSPSLVETVDYDSLGYESRIPDSLSILGYWLPFIVLTTMIVFRWKVNGVVLGKPRRPGPYQLMLAAAAGVAFSIAVVTLLRPLSGSLAGQAEALVSSVGWSSLIVGMVLISPILEELLFREMLFREMLREGRAVLGALVLSVLFGLLHVSFGYSAVVALVLFASSLAFSLGMCFLYWKTRSVTVCAVAHSAGNAGLVFQAIVA